MFLKELFEKYKWKAFILPYILLRIPALCLFVLNNDEFVSFRMLSNLKQYMIFDVRLPFYDYFFVKIYTFIFGYNFFPLRIVNLLMGMFTLYFIFNFFLDVLGKKGAYLASLIYTLAPVFVFYNIFTESYNLSILCITACVFYTRKRLSGSLSKREEIFFLFLNLILVFTHYLNIALMGIFYFFITLKNRKFLKYFLVFLLLTAFPIGLRIYDSFFIQSGYGSSELLDPNLRALSIYPYNNVFSVFLYTFTGIKSSVNLFVYLFMFLCIPATWSFIKNNKKVELNIMIISGYIYFLLLGMISNFLDMRLFSRSFSSDYLTITALFMIFPVVWQLLNRYKYILFSLIVIMIFSNIFIYRDSYIINRQYLQFKRFVEEKDPTFIISDHITSESKTKEAIRLFFSEFRILNTNDVILEDKGFYIVNLRFPKESLINLDEKTLKTDNKRLEERYLQMMDIKNSISNMKYIREFKVGGNIFVVYEKI